MTESQLSNNDLYIKLIEAIKCENEKSKNEIKEHIEQENIKLLGSIKEQREKISELENKYESLWKRTLDLERRSRKNNVIVLGLTVNAQVNVTSLVLEKLSNLLEINITERDLSDVFPLNNSSNPPIKLEFVSHRTKDLIFKNVSKLKGTNIAIRHDMCYEDRLDNKVLVKHLKAAREKQLTAKIKGNKLIINGDPYTAKQLKVAEEEEVVETGVTQNPKKREREANSAPSTPSTPLQKEVSNDLQYSVENSNDVLNNTIHPQTKKTKTQVTNAIGIIETRNRKGSASSQQKHK